MYWAAIPTIPFIIILTLDHTQFLNKVIKGKVLLRRALRQIGAIIAILFILFMNVGSFALQAHAAGDWDAPKWDAPKWDAPTWDAPTWEVEEWESPDWELSEWKATEWKSPEWELSEWKAPEWNGSEWVVPNLNSPMHQGGNGKQESVNDNVNIDDPESSVKLPDGTTIPTDKEGPTHPTLDKIVPQPEEPFFTIDGPTPYSGGKLAKDIAKETINFVDKVLKTKTILITILLRILVNQERI